MSLAKQVIICYNFFFWMLGVFVLGLAAFVYSDYQPLLKLSTNTAFHVHFYLIMGVGGAMACVGLLGCCSAIKKSRYLLGIYIIFCILLTIVCSATIGSGIQNKDHISKGLQDGFEQFILKNYHGQSRNVEKSIDAIQRLYKCCGSKSITDWAESIYNREIIVNVTFPTDINVNRSKYRVPASCCVQYRSLFCETIRNGITNFNQHDRFKYLHSEGCAGKLDSFVNNQWHVLLYILCGLSAFQTTAFILSVAVCCAADKQRAKQLSTTID